ncbi:hypothetical protein [Streptomyces sp. NPDC101165]|uniref:hypothetical protein n=1 Tax=Streptomyces sp. NPDC101165 TaxID=3366119 RepID=UPI00382E3AA2
MRGLKLTDRIGRLGRHVAVVNDGRQESANGKVESRCATYQQALAVAVDELGVGDTTYLHTEVRGLLDGRPWQEALRWNQVETYVRVLHTAFPIVIAECRPATPPGGRTRVSGKADEA